MYAKYPKTYHLPWSEGITNDDKVMTKMSFEGQRVIVTEKMDGENTTMYHDHIHARSIDSKYHPSRDWVKGFWGSIKHSIPKGDRICGENMFAQHSIAYDNLPSYFLGFSVWDGVVCSGWDQTIELFDEIGITPVPVLYDGVYNETLIRDLWNNMDPEVNEGYVVRVARGIYSNIDWTEVVGKFVRPAHVQTDEHWMHKQIVPNGLAK